jgi:hypothetical protein
MSAIGLRPTFESRARLIGAHADYSRNDFIFPRTQSPALRATPWEHRIKPRLAWGEIYAYGMAAVVGTLLATVLI